jgi:hypothetical protein
LIITRTNNYWHYGDIRHMLTDADKERFRAAGDPLPSAGPFKLYRGVAGLRGHRAIGGYSWTSSIDVAAWFANRFSAMLPDPAVYTLWVPEEYVMAYTDGRQEQEFIVQLPWMCQPKRCLSGPELIEAAERKQRQITAERLAYIHSISSDNASEID